MIFTHQSTFSSQNRKYTDVVGKDAAVNLIQSWLFLLAVKVPIQERFNVRAAEDVAPSHSEGQRSTGPQSDWRTFIKNDLNHHKHEKNNVRFYVNVPKIQK